MPSLLIVNPVAREVAADRSLPDRMRSILQTHGVACELHVTTAAGEAPAVVRESIRRGLSPIVVAGGDGTINEVVNGLADSDVPLGLIPVGTGNALARQIGLKPGDIEGACRAIAAGRTRRMDLGCLNGRFFASMAGVGLDAHVARRVGGLWKTWVGPYAFVGQFLATAVTLKPWYFQAELDGQPLSGMMWAWFVCNTAQYTWRVRLTPDARTDDGRLDFVLFRRCGRGRLVAIAADIFLRGKAAAGHRGMHVLTGSRVTLTTEPTAPWHVDGDVAGVTPVECAVHPGALRLIVP